MFMYTLYDILKYETNRKFLVFFDDCGFIT